MSVGRNDPCPCGSGRKYKQCCGLGKEPGQGAPKAALQALGSQAAAHFGAGRLPQAEGICRQILQLAPDHSDALHILGAVAQQVGKSQQAG
jgi:Flp pilus assembly protein TadD